jgi:pimeloyl-ACP methyl ester carboxylesterase
VLVQTVIIGHSTGGDACLRVMEQVPVLGAIILAAGPTPLKPGEEREVSISHTDHHFVIDFNRVNVVCFI